MYPFSIYCIILHYSLLSVSYIHRSEFPGLKASPNWVLCDAAGGTQVSPQTLPPRFFRPIKDFSGPSMCSFFWPKTIIFQAHQCVVSAVGASLASSTANLGGTYPSALQTIRGRYLQEMNNSKPYLLDAGMARARDTVAAFLNSSPEEVPPSLILSLVLGHFWSQHDNADPPCLQVFRH